MTVTPKLFKLPRRAGLTAEQIHMYSQERMMNFRWISRITATYSSLVLKPADVVSPELFRILSEFGQFAEVAYSPLSTTFIFENLEQLLKADFPLEGYHAIRESKLIKSIRGKVANLGAYVAYRPSTKQLIVSISGTSNLTQAFYDIKTLKHRHPIGYGCAVHVGFWRMYEGLKPDIFEAITKGLRENEVTELVLTGHSMGGAMSYLLAIDLLTPGGTELPHALPIILAVFGSPRVANPQLLQVWLDLMKDYRSKYGADALKEYSVKAYKDGVPSLPPKWLGFRHFALEPMYLRQGRLYHTPPAESEYTLFHVMEEEEDDERDPPYPRGGHNYYFYDMEKLARRLGWIDEMLAKDPEGWETRYMARVAKRERGLSNKSNKSNKSEADSSPISN